LKESKGEAERVFNQRESQGNRISFLSPKFKKALVFSWRQSYVTAEKSFKTWGVVEGEMRGKDPRGERGGGGSKKKDGDDCDARMIVLLSVAEVKRSWERRGGSKREKLLKVEGGENETGTRKRGGMKSRSLFVGHFLNALEGAGRGDAQSRSSEEKWKWCRSTSGEGIAREGRSAYRLKRPSLGER